jgi:hypothetical protein
MLRFCVIVAAILATAVIVVAAGQSVTYERSIRCLLEKQRRLPSATFNLNRLDAKRRQLFDNVLTLAIRSELSTLHPEWFVGRGGCAAQPTPSNAFGEALLFLAQFAPAQDVDKLPLEYFLDTVTYSLSARSLFPFARIVPWPLFLSDVLPYSLLSEPRHPPWRKGFFTFFKTNFLKQLLNISSPAAAAEWMNENAYNMKTVLTNGTAPRITYFGCQSDFLCGGYSPEEVLLLGNASCTGLSEFLVASQRSVGLPSRIAGTPHWNLGPSVCPQGDQSDACGDHSWAEVATPASDGSTPASDVSSSSSWSWSFQDSDATIQLNQSWFVPQWTKHQSPYDGTSVNHTIFASSWAPSTFVVNELWPQGSGAYDFLSKPASYYPMAWNWTGPEARISSAFDVTRRYLTFDPKKRK